MKQIDYAFMRKLHAARDAFFKEFEEMGFKIDIMTIERETKDE